jgi:hypothetical protein
MKNLFVVALLLTTNIYPMDRYNNYINKKRLSLTNAIIKELEKSNKKNDQSDCLPSIRRLMVRTSATIQRYFYN